MFTAAAIQVRPSQFAGAAEVVALQARRAIDASRGSYNDRLACIDLLHRLADSHPALPTSLLDGLRRAAAILQAG